MAILIEGVDLERIVALKAWGQWWDVVKGSCEKSESRLHFKCAASGRRISVNFYNICIFAEDVDG